MRILSVVLEKKLFTENLFSWKSRKIPADMFALKIYLAGGFPSTNVKLEHIHYESTIAPLPRTSPSTQHQKKFAEITKRGRWSANSNRDIFRPLQNSGVSFVSHVSLLNLHFPARSGPIKANVLPAVAFLWEGGEMNPMPEFRAGSKQICYSNLPTRDFFRKFLLLFSGDVWAQGLGGRLRIRN